MRACEHGRHCLHSRAMVGAVTGTSATRCRRPWYVGRLPVAFLCISLVMLASAERRLWESDFNTASSLNVKNGEASKVIHLLLDVDRIGEPGASGITLAPIARTLVPRQTAVALAALGHPESRAPPR